MRTIGVAVALLATVAAQWEIYPPLTARPGNRRNYQSDKGSLSPRRGLTLNPYLS